MTLRKNTPAATFSEAETLNSYLQRHHENIKKNCSAKTKDYKK